MGGRALTEGQQTNQRLVLDRNPESIIAKPDLDGAPSFAPTSFLFTVYRGHASPDCTGVEDSEVGLMLVPSSPPCRAQPTCDPDTFWQKASKLSTFSSVKPTCHIYGPFNVF